MNKRDIARLRSEEARILLAELAIPRKPSAPLPSETELLDLVSAKNGSRRRAKAALTALSEAGYVKPRGSVEKRAFHITPKGRAFEQSLEGVVRSGVSGYLHEHLHFGLGSGRFAGLAKAGSVSTIATTAVQTAVVTLAGWQPVSAGLAAVQIASMAVAASPAVANAAIHVRQAREFERRQVAIIEGRETLSLERSTARDSGLDGVPGATRNLGGESQYLSHLPLYQTLGRLPIPDPPENEGPTRNSRPAPGFDSPGFDR